jgi:hypothetical protein
MTILQAAIIRAEWAEGRKLRVHAMSLPSSVPGLWLEEVATRAAKQRRYARAVQPSAPCRAGTSP